MFGGHGGRQPVADPGFGRGGGHNGRCGYRWGRIVSGGAPGRVPPSRPARGMGERCKLPHREALQF